MCKRFLLCFGTFLLSGIIFALCFVGVDASAAETYVKMSASDFRAILGDSLPFSYVYQGSSFSSSFSYYSSNYGFFWDNGGMNIDSNSVFTSVSGASQYDTIVYRAHVSGSGLFENINVDCFLRFSGGARGGVMLSTSPGSVSNPDAATNMISIGGNYWGDFSALSANPAAIATLADYYAVISARTPDSGYLRDFRPILYDSTDFTLDNIHYNSVDSSSYRGDYYLYLVFFCPYSYGDISTEPIITTAPSSGGQTIINNNVDLTETHSILGNIANFIQGIPQAILNGIRNIFVPSEGFMDEQLEEVKDSFVWYEQIQAVGNDLKVVFGQEQFNDAPIVTLHASQMSSRWSGKQYMSEDELVLDFGEFADYRSSIHTVISVLLWAFFLWRLFARLPDIIHGAGIATVDTININRELDGRCDDAAQDVVNSSSKYFR